MPSSRRHGTCSCTVASWRGSCRQQSSRRQLSSGSNALWRGRVWHPPQLSTCGRQAASYWTLQPCVESASRCWRGCSADAHLSSERRYYGARAPVPRPGTGRPCPSRFHAGSLRERLR
eukprot:4607179-Prymnesium_polylepis.1